MPQRILWRVGTRLTAGFWDHFSSSEHVSAIVLQLNYAQKSNFESLIPVSKIEDMEFEEDDEKMEEENEDDVPHIASDSEVTKSPQ